MALGRENEFRDPKVPCLVAGRNIEDGPFSIASNASSKGDHSWPPPWAIPQGVPRSLRVLPMPPHPHFPFVSPTLWVPRHN